MAQAGSSRDGHTSAAPPAHTPLRSDAPPSARASLDAAPRPARARPRAYPADDIDAQWSAERRRLMGWASGREATLGIAAAPHRAPPYRVQIDLTPPTASPRTAPVAVPSPPAAETALSDTAETRTAETSETQTSKTSGTRTAVTESIGLDIVHAPIAVEHPVRSGRAARRPGRGLIAATVVVAAAAVASIGYATTRTGGSDPAPRRSSPAAIAPPVVASSTAASISARERNLASAVLWASSNLDHTVRLLADAPTAQQLTDAGFSRVQTTLPGGPDWVVSDPTTRSRSDFGALLAVSVPVARFGTGADTVDVESVLEVSAQRVPVVLAADLANRKLAGSALAINPQVLTTPSQRELLRAGDVNLRAATFLALLSADTTARVLDISQAKAETNAGRPRRVLTLDVSAAAVRAVIRSLPAAYAPRSAVVDGSSMVLTWSSSVRPVQPVS